MMAKVISIPPNFVPRVYDNCNSYMTGLYQDQLCLVPLHHVCLVPLHHICLHGFPPLQLSGSRPPHLCELSALSSLPPSNLNNLDGLAPESWPMPLALCSYVDLL